LFLRMKQVSPCILVWEGVGGSAEDGCGFRRPVNIGKG
jgi:hypothetical protein